MSSNGIVWPSGDGGRLLQKGIGCSFRETEPAPIRTALRFSETPLSYCSKSGKVSLEVITDGYGLRSSIPRIRKLLAK